MKIRIISEGVGHTTRIETEDGKPVEGVMAVKWWIEGNNVAFCELTMRATEIDALAEVDKILVHYPPSTRPKCPNCGRPSLTGAIDTDDVTACENCHAVVMVVENRAVMIREPLEKGQEYESGRKRR